MPERIQLRRTRGWRLQEVSLALNGLEAVKVDRTTRWGNPFRVGDPVGDEIGVDYFLDASQAVREFEIWLEGRGLHVPNSTAGKPPTLDEIRAALRGKNLACWCKLPKAGETDLCHAAVLLRISNE